MKRRFIVIIIFSVLVSLSVPFPAMASVGGDSWDFWDLLGGIGDLLSSFVTAVLDGLVKLFIPSSTYFDRVFIQIRDNFNSKFGGIIGISNYLSNAFSDLKLYRGSSGLFVLKFPENHLFAGKSVNLMAGSEGIANMVRMALSGAITLFTVSFAYKKVVLMIKS